MKIDLEDPEVPGGDFLIVLNKKPKEIQAVRQARLYQSMRARHDFQNIWLCAGYAPGFPRPSLRTRSSREEIFLLFLIRNCKEIDLGGPGAPGRRLPYCFKSRGLRQGYAPYIYVRFRCFFRGYAPRYAPHIYIYIYIYICDSVTFLGGYAPRSAPYIYIYIYAIWTRAGVRRDILWLGLHYLLNARGHIYIYVYMYIDIYIYVFM